MGAEDPCFDLHVADPETRRAADADGRDRELDVGVGIEPGLGTCNGGALGFLLLGVEWIAGQTPPFSERGLGGGNLLAQPLEPSAVVGGDFRRNLGLEETVPDERRLGKGIQDPTRRLVMITVPVGRDDQPNGSPLCLGALDPAIGDRGIGGRVDHDHAVGGDDSYGVSVVEAGRVGGQGSLDAGCDLGPARAARLVGWCLSGDRKGTEKHQAESRDRPGPGKVGWTSGVGSSRIGGSELERVVHGGSWRGRCGANRGFATKRCMLIRNLSPHVWLITDPSQGKYPEANGLLVQGADSSLLIDAPKSMLDAPALDELPAWPDRVVLSHCHEDHLPGLARPDLQRLPLEVHAADAFGLESLESFLDLFGMPEPFRSAWAETVVERFHYRPRPDASTFTDGEVWDLGGVQVEVVHTPGHTAGHCVFRIQPDDIVFLADIDLSGFGPYYGDAVSDLEAFERSLERIAGWTARWFVSGHHIGAVDQATFEDRMVRYRARIPAREERLLAFLGEARTLGEMIEHRIIYRPGDQVAGADWIERRSIEQHLERLERDGRLERADDEHGEARWRARPG